jgi:hypothetical protein
MIPYFVILCFILILTFLGHNKASSVLIYLILFVLLGFKGEVGCDYLGYLGHYMYHNPNETIFKLRGEIGWWYIADIIYRYEMDYQWYYITSAFISCFFIFLAQSNVKSFGLILLLYPLIFLQLGMSGIRQFIAVSIIIYTLSLYMFKKQESIIPYIILIVIAATFHISALILLIFLPFLMRVKTYIIVILIIAGVGGMMSSLAGEVLAQYDIRYLGEVARTSSGAWYRFALTVFIILMTIFRKNSHYFKLGMTIIIIGTVLGIFNSIALHRFNFYLYPIAVLIVLSNVRNNRNQIPVLRISYAMIIGYMIFWFNFSTHSSCIIPYKLCF